MPTLPRSAAIAGIFALAQDYFPDKQPDWPRWASPKLNGVRAMWVPGAGLFSRDGIPYEDGVLPHIEAACKALGNVWLDGELYCHGMPLQHINARAGVNRKKPHAECEKIVFNIFDLPQVPDSAEARYNQLGTMLRGMTSPLARVPQHLCSCRAKADACNSANLAQNYEGTMYKHPGGYIPGRSSMLLRRKLWLDGEFAVVELLAGDGKFDHSMGGVLCALPDGRQFHVGSFEFDDDERLRLWCEFTMNGTKPAQVKVQFRERSADGTPCRGKVISFLP